VEVKLVRHEADLRLATGAAAGSLADWHEFVLRYSGLILSLVRRYLSGFDDDTQRSIYVETLEHFFRTGLARYDGECTLPTWVITVTRSRCMDALRAAYGRNRRPRWLSRFSKRDRQIYRLYFVEQLDAGAVVSELQRRGHEVEMAEVLATLERLDAAIDTRSRTRLAYQLQARSVGRVSARLLEYLDHARLQSENQRHDLQPDASLIESEARDVLARVHACLQRLPESERRALELRYQEGLTEICVAGSMGLRSRRAAQVLIQRALASLRRTLK
jgi:RNA polymerase sigma factor (sigma-70 family)